MGPGSVAFGPFERMPAPASPPIPGGVTIFEAGQSARGA